MSHQYPETLYEIPESWGGSKYLLSEDETEKYAKSLEMAFGEAGDIGECIEFDLIKVIGQQALYAGGWHDQCGDHRRWVCIVSREENGYVFESQHDTLEEAEAA